MNLGLTRGWGVRNTPVVALLLSCALVLADPGNNTPASAPADIAPHLVHPERVGLRRLAATDRPRNDRGARVNLGTFNIDRFEDEDRLWENVPGLPLRIGVNRDLPGGPVSCTKAGQWSTTPDGTRLWTLDLEVPGAKGIRVHFSRFELPTESRLLAYGDGLSGGMDVYTGRGPTGKGAFWAATVPGEVIHLEYQATAGIGGNPAIEIDRISHIYNNPTIDRLAAVDSGDIPAEGMLVPMSVLPCQEDVNCHSVDPVARDAVGRMEFTIGGYTYLCSGGLLADSDANTYAGYLLTANHCLSTQEVVDTLTVYWFYQTESCDGPFPSLLDLPKSIGGTLLATSSTSDFTFIRLADDPGDGQGFASWTTGSASGALTSIHHPQGTFKRVSIGALTGEPPVCSSFPTSNYWYLDWTTGITESGSSGSPLYNSNWEVVGQLYGACVNYGASVECDNPEDYNIMYGKFGVTYPSIAGWLSQVATDDDYEDNDVLGEAAPIVSGNHALYLVDFEDYFGICSPRTGQITVSMTYNSSEFLPLLELRRPDGTLITQSQAGTGTETVTANLPAGRYIIHLYKLHKWGGAYTLNISLPAGYSDFDADGDVDMTDFGHLQQCFTGTGTVVDSTCYDACLDGSSSIDDGDVAAFNGCFSGPNVQAAAGCTP
jgi:hypothetical protein